LPPYITKARREDAEPSPDEAPEDRERYQTVYAGPERGSVAAPTAGLHFTDEVLQTLADRGVEIARVRLHVGAGTFQPVREEVVEKHPIHREFFRIEPQEARKMCRAAGEGRRIVAVGTTTVRALETAALAAAEPSAADKVFEAADRMADNETGPNREGPVPAIRGWTSLLISPGFRFRAVGALLTNFHLPRSSLLALVSALAGADTIRDAYAEAIARRYRFYSYGDCMLIEKGRQSRP
jgi:S-adenosylmethionine:tRNA ribosyltransferase-isomerase